MRVKCKDERGEKGGRKKGGGGRKKSGEGRREGQGKGGEKMGG